MGGSTGISLCDHPKSQRCLAGPFQLPPTADAVPLHQDTWHLCHEFWLAWGAGSSSAWGAWGLAKKDAYLGAKHSVAAVIIPGKCFTVPALRFSSLPSDLISRVISCTCIHSREHSRKPPFSFIFPFQWKGEPNPKNHIFLTVFLLNHLHTLLRCLTTPNYLNLIFNLCNTWLY